MKKGSPHSEKTGNGNNQRNITKKLERNIANKIVNTNLIEAFEQKVNVKEQKIATLSDKNNIEVEEKQNINQENVIVIDHVTSTIHDNQNNTKSNYNIKHTKQTMNIEEIIDSLSNAEDEIQGEVYDTLYLRDLILGSSQLNIKGIIGSLEPISNYLRTDLSSYKKLMKSVYNILYNATMCDNADLLENLMLLNDVLSLFYGEMRTICGIVKYGNRLKYEADLLDKMLASENQDEHSDYAALFRCVSKNQVQKIIQNKMNLIDQYKSSILKHISLTDSVHRCNVENICKKILKILHSINTTEVSEYVMNKSNLEANNSNYSSANDSVPMNDYKEDSYSVISNFSAIVLLKYHDVKTPVYDSRYTNRLSEFFYTMEEAKAIANERSNYDGELYDSSAYNVYTASVREEAAKHMNNFNDEFVHFECYQIL